MLFSESRLILSFSFPSNPIEATNAERTQRFPRGIGRKTAHLSIRSNRRALMQSLPLK